MKITGPLDASLYPAILQSGDYREKHRVPWRYVHDGALRCCLLQLFALREAGALSDPDPCSCKRAWKQDAHGVWRIESLRLRKLRPVVRVGRTNHTPRPRTLGAVWMTRKKR